MNPKSYTTLAEIRAQVPCEDGWRKLLDHLGKTKADNEPLSLLTILESNGLDDALWCLRCPSLERLSRHFQAWCAEQVLHIFEAEYPEDPRIRDQIAMLRNDAASNAVRAAAWDAARDAAGVTAWDAARAAAYAAAGDSAWEAAGVTTWDVARDAARSAAYAAAGDSARASAWDAARASAWDVSWSSSMATTGAAQEAQLRLMLTQGEPQ